MSKRRTTAWGVVAAVAAAIAGCSAGPVAPPGSVATGPDDLRGQKIEVTAVWADAEQASFRKVLDKFEQKTGAEVSYTSAGDELPTVLQTRLAGGAPPDVAIVAQPGLVTTLARAGSLKPLGPGVAAVMDAQFTPVWKQLGSVDGTLYGVVFKAANKSTVWYDVTTVGAGFTPPATLDDLVDILTTAADSGRTLFTVGAADGWTLTDVFENVYLRSAGPENYDKLARHEIPWTDPTVRAAFAEVGKLFQDPFLPGGRQGVLQTEFSASVVDVFGPAPKASIVFEGDFVAGVIADSTTSVVGEDADYFPFPVVGTGSGVVAGGDTVIALTDRPATQALVEYLAGADAAAGWVADGGFISPNIRVPLDSYADPTQRRIAEDLVTADRVRFDMSDLMPPALGGTKGAGFWKSMQDYVADPAAVDTILTALEAQAVTAYQGG